MLKQDSGWRVGEETTEWASSEWPRSQRTSILKDPHYHSGPPRSQLCCPMTPESFFREIFILELVSSRFLRATSNQKCCLTQVDQKTLRHAFSAPACGMPSDWHSADIAFAIPFAALQLWNCDMCETWCLDQCLISKFHRSLRAASDQRSVGLPWRVSSAVPRICCSWTGSLEWLPKKVLSKLGRPGRKLVTYGAESALWRWWMPTAGEFQPNSLWDILQRRGSFLWMPVSDHGKVANSNGGGLRAKDSGILIPWTERLWAQPEVSAEWLLCRLHLWALYHTGGSEPCISCCGHSSHLQEVGFALALVQL